MNRVLASEREKGPPRPGMEAVTAPSQVPARLGHSSCGIPGKALELSDTV